MYSIFHHALALSQSRDVIVASECYPPLATLLCLPTVFLLGAENPSRRKRWNSCLVPSHYSLVESSIQNPFSLKQMPKGRPRLLWSLTLFLSSLFSLLHFFLLCFSIHLFLSLLGLWTSTLLIPAPVYPSPWFTSHLGCGLPQGTRFISWNLTMAENSCPCVRLHFPQSKAMLTDWPQPPHLLIIAVGGDFSFCCSTTCFTPSIPVLQFTAAQLP